MKIVDKTRVEFYIPSKADINYEDTFEFFKKHVNVYFRGCTIIDKVDGYYRYDRSMDIVKDIVNIVIVDISNPIFEVENVIESLTGYLERNLDEKEIYFTYYSVKGPDIKQP